MKVRGWLLTSGLVGSGLLAVFGDRTPDASQAPTEVVRSSPGQGLGLKSDAVHPVSLAPSAPSSSPALLEIVDRTVLIGERAHDPNPSYFASHSWNPAPQVTPAQPIEEPAPTPPPLPFVYLGRQFKAGRWEVFVSEGEATLILRESQTIDSRYHVDSIAPPTMTLTYLPLHAQTSISIE